MHQNVCAPLLNYFSPDRTVSLDVSSGQHDAIWDKVCKVFTNLGLHAWRPVDSVLVFALGRASAASAVILAGCCLKSYVAIPCPIDSLALHTIYVRSCPVYVQDNKLRS